MRQDLPVVVFSHLRWDFVYQRPQHLLARLAQTRKVYFIEEPVASESGAAHWKISQPAPNINVYRPATTCTVAGFSDEQVPDLALLMRQFVEKEELHEYVVWLYTPMALPLVKLLQPRAVVFDIMDELSAFKGAPKQLAEREAEAMHLADVVFTGGLSLFNAKKDRHQNIHLFPSSVDAEHFAKAHSITEASDQRLLAHPRLGYFGVIDERLDLGLLRLLSSSHPEWQIIMVGPVVKILPSSLPKAHNLHYFGSRSYAELPTYLAGWDVCLVPFALNESTRFISPTKVLEYMAAKLPIVSTRINDVAVPFGNIVYISDSPGEFVSNCEFALSAGREEQWARTQAMERVLETTSWDKTAAAMSSLLSDAIRRRNANGATVGGHGS